MAPLTRQEGAARGVGESESREALIALGANLGDRLDTLSNAASDVARLGTVLARSSLYETEPVGGPAGQPRYLNAVLRLAPAPEWADPLKLLDALLEIELRYGRTRRIRNEARTLDLDLLDVQGVVRDDVRLTLPHPRMMQRAFVLAPLLDVAPTWRHPETGALASEALARLDVRGVTRSVHGWDAR